MSAKNFLCTCVLALFLFACGHDSLNEYASEGVPSATMSAEKSYYGDDEEIEMDASRTAEAPLPPSGQDTETDKPRQQRIIYTAAARARVESLDTAMARITSLITRNGGYISNQHRTNSTYEHTAQLTIRLPAGALDGAMKFLPEIATEIDYQNLDSRDVTAQWLDLESRLQTKRDVRDRYIDILRNRAQKVEDILNAEEKIRVITEEIEAKEGQLRYLRDQVSLSTLTLELYETVEYRNTGPTVTRGFFSKLTDSLAFGWGMIQEIVLGLVAIWPLLILGAGVFFVVKRWRSKRSGK
ncbi:DUF4349 domain-containing protein [Neolewinella aurantiaca]|uniref:DUF4349 domain-containing protein n=1 Tax=Neolewinella aurantiaca TaxID=2602767 RepID=A0A5C7FR29_9BACT|nr:DUF4349 domain-containing protein [Neolewinella aurantiaca]TXF87864.1 DUF4349 domain-containing protein [Neolewinella aurantiaca]